MSIRAFSYGIGESTRPSLDPRRLRNNIVERMSGRVLSMGASECFIDPTGMSASDASRPEASIRSAIMYKSTASSSLNFASDQVATAKILQKSVFRPLGVGCGATARPAAHPWQNVTCCNFVLTPCKSCDGEQS